MGLVEDGKLSFKGRKEGFAEGRIDSRFITIKKREWRFLHGAMRGGIVVELSSRKELGPRGWIIGTKDPKICFKFLIGSFSLSISLRVVCCGESYIIFEKASEFPSEGGGELGTMIKDNCVI